MTEQQILALKEELKARAARKFPDDKERQNAYIWGTLNKVKKQS
jgi:hypothetical protein